MSPKIQPFDDQCRGVDRSTFHFNDDTKTEEEKSGRSKGITTKYSFCVVEKGDLLAPEWSAPTVKRVLSRFVSCVDDFEANVLY